MNPKRHIEVFSAGCSACEETVNLIRRIACRVRDISVLNMHDVEVARRAEAFGIHAVPAVRVEGKLAACCTAGSFPDEATLRALGVGNPIMT